MSPIRNPIRAFLIYADGVEGLSMVYKIPLPRIILWIRKGAVPGWVSMYESGPGKGVGYARCGSSGFGDECVPQMESPIVSWAVTTGRADG